MSISFIDNIDYCPLDGPIDHPHVIAIDSYVAPDESDGATDHLKIWDAVATMLHTISLDTLKDFLMPERNDFRIVIVSQSHDERLVVWRIGTDVFVRCDSLMHCHNS